MKEKIAGVLIIILLVTAILPIYVFGDEEDEEEEEEEEDTSITYSYGSFKKLQDEGKADQNLGGTSITKNISTGLSISSTIGGGLGSIILAPIITIQKLMSVIAGGSITIEEIVFNECDLMNANYTEESSNIYNEAVRQSVMKFFYAVRMLAIAISLAVFIYVGIKTAISEIASEKAKAKQMLVNWIVSFAIIFIIQYIIVIAMAISDTIVEFLAGLRADSFEGEMMNDILKYLFTTKGWSFIAILIMYIVLVFYQFRFMFFYIKRFFAIGFLIVISPLITITYAIDKAGDGKAQALNIWLREFLSNIFIQPLHALIYLIFIVSANEIFKVAPLLAVLFLAMLSRAEKIVKNIFKLKGHASMKDISEIMGMKK